MVVSLCVPGKGRTESPSSSRLLGEGEGSFFSLFVFISLPLGAREVAMEHTTFQLLMLHCDNVLYSHNVT